MTLCISSGSIVLPSMEIRTSIEPKLLLLPRALSACLPAYLPAGIFLLGCCLGLQQGGRAATGSRARQVHVTPVFFLDWFGLFFALQIRRGFTCDVIHTRLVSEFWSCGYLCVALLHHTFDLKTAERFCLSSDC